MTTDPEIIRQFEELGPDVVRARLGQLPHLDRDAMIWLAQKDRERREREDASNSEQTALARSAKSLAERSASAAQMSNKIAAAALIVAIIAMVASIIGLVHTDGHDDAPKSQAAAKTH